jgi:hypothetical protein
VTVSVLARPAEAIRNRFGDAYVMGCCQALGCGGIVIEPLKDFPVNVAVFACHE